MAQTYSFNRDNARRKKGDQSLKEAINDLLDFYKIKSKYNETYLVAYWEKIMGKTIASRTEEVYVSEKKLFLKVNSAPLRNELVLAKHKIIELINREIGEDIIEEVIFI